MKKHLKAILILELALLVFHLPYLNRMKAEYRALLGTKSFEDTSHYLGDSTAYLEAMQSTFNAKWKDKFHRKEFGENSTPWLIGYSFPSLRFGAALIGATITAPFPRFIYDFAIQRLALAGLMANIILLVLIYFLTFSINGSSLSAILAASFFILNPVEAHNSYSYFSHTVMGLIPLLAALLLFLNSSMQSKLSWFFLYILLSIASLSSTHTVVFALVYGSMFLTLAKNKNIGVRLPHYLVPASIGALLPIAYIFLVESFLRFREHHVATWWDHLRFYGDIAKRCYGDFAFWSHFIWDWRVFNSYYGITLFLILLLATRFYFKGFKFPLFLRATCELNKRVSVIFIGAFLATLILGSLGMPHSRSALTSLVFWDVSLALAFGSFSFKGDRIAPIYAGFILFLYSLNFGNSLGLFTFPSKLLEAPFRGAKIIPLEDGRNQSLENFVSTKLREGIDPKLTLVLMDPAHLVLNYSHWHLFFSTYIEPREEIVNITRLKQDSPNLVAIFNLTSDKVLNPSRWYITERKIWPMVYWDQEQNFPLLYENQFRNFVQHNSLEKIDMTKLYFIPFSDLLRATALPKIPKTPSLG